MPTMTNDTLQYDVVDGLIDANSKSNDYRSARAQYENVDAPFGSAQYDTVDAPFGVAQYDTIDTPLQQYDTPTFI
jgi:hypothetical protein